MAKSETDFNLEKDESKYIFNMSLETLKRMNQLLYGMASAKIQNDFMVWRSFSDALDDELSPFCNEEDFKRIKEAITKVNKLQLVYNRYKFSSSDTSRVDSKMREALKQYDRILRDIMQKLGFLMAKGEDVRFVTHHQFQ